MSLFPCSLLRELTEWIGWVVREKGQIRPREQTVKRNGMVLIYQNSPDGKATSTRVFSKNMRHQRRNIGRATEVYYRLRSPQQNEDQARAAETPAPVLSDAYIHHHHGHSLRTLLLTYWLAARNGKQMLGQRCCSYWTCTPCVETATVERASSKIGNECSSVLVESEVAGSNK